MHDKLMSVAAACAMLAWGCDDSNSMYHWDAGADAFVPDGTQPCHTYTDTDGDTIPDSIEGEGDADGDGTPNYLDDDSDGDTIPDAQEAGDDDLCTAPANTDWGVDAEGDTEGDDDMDFLDSDSDNDGVSDADENAVWGTDPTRKDTDGDGITDLGEVAAGTDPTDSTSTIDEDDYFVILPYMAPEHEFRELVFGTTLKVADVYFLIDTTGSMDSAIENVATSLASGIVPALRVAIPDVQMGVGHFNDVPSGGYGSSNDQPYWNVVNITDDDTEVQGGLNSLYGSVPWGSGSDTPESNAIALYLTATGNGFTECSSNVPPQTCPAHPDEMSPRVGYPCFRPDALPIIVHVTDAPWHNDHEGANPYDCTPVAYANALAELMAINARHVGVFVNNFGTEGLAAMERMSIDTGSVDASGNPLIENTDSGSVSSGIVSMIETLATATPQDVNAEGRDVVGDPPEEEYDASVFVKDITPISGFPAPPTGYSSQDDTYFYDVVPGTDVRFEIDFYNNTVEPEDHALVFKATIAVLGNDVALLDERLVIIIVPTEGMGDIII
jgi:hypothetical protein